MNPKEQISSVVVVGGGFSGLTTALELSNAQPEISIILIEPRANFTFAPLLFEVLSGEVQLWEIAPVYKVLIANRGINLIQDVVVTINLEKDTVITQSGLSINYAQLVICTGSKIDSLGVPGVLEYALIFNSLKDVKILKERINRLKVEKNNHPLVIVGAGPVGIELACKISDILNQKVQINIIEVDQKVLPKGTKYNRDQVKKACSKRGIIILNNSTVKSISSDKIYFESDHDNFSKVQILNYSYVIWAAGSQPVLPDLIPEQPLKNGKVLVNSFLQINGYPNVFAIGDVAYNQENDCAPTAQAAMQQASNAVQNIISWRKSKTMQPFKFKDWGEMLSLGIGKATITSMGLTISGSKAFLLRRFIYFTKMPLISLGIRGAAAWLLSKTNKV